jgi:hypothetical protein
MKHITLSILSAVCALSACGPSGAKIASGKQAAAEALYLASMPTEAKPKQTANPADTVGVWYTCPRGGIAELSDFKVGTLEANSNAIGVPQQFVTTYRNCGMAEGKASGTALYNGTMTMTQGVTSMPSDGQQIKNEYKIKGRLFVQGAFDDFLEIDVTQSLIASGVNVTAGTVAMLVKGTVSNSSGSYAFDEVVNLIPGQISVEVTKK